MKRYFPFLLIAGVALLTVGISAMVLRAKERTRAASGMAIGADGKLAIRPLHVVGDETAAVMVEEFGDFQCPACAVTSSVIRSLEKEFGAQLRVIFWEFPLAMHRNGRRAALAAEAASRQGRFWEMHDLLYQNQNSWKDLPDPRSEFEKFATQLKLDPEQFRKDLDSPAVAARVDAEHQHGESRGVKNTPTIFINNQEFPPPFIPERFRAAIIADLPGKKAPSPHGP